MELEQFLDYCRSLDIGHRPARLLCAALLFSFSLNHTTAKALEIDELIDPTVNEKVVMMPVQSNGQATRLQTTIFSPPGEGPFPVILMNHGKRLGKASHQKRQRYLAMSREFVKRGYAVVVPMRKGFAKSEGEYSDLGCNIADNGQWQADDIEAVLLALKSMPSFDHQRVILAGESYGGLAALALGTRQVPGIKAIINFSGGLRIHDDRCDWQESLVDAIASYGALSSVPSLWFYGENDQLFSQSLALRLQQAYQTAGGSAELVLFGKFKRDAHQMIGSPDGLVHWLAPTERFLARLGLPSDPSITLEQPKRPMASGFAVLDDVGAVPHLSQAGRLGYQDYLSKSTPRAFAISATGAWGWAEDGDDPAARALTTCQKHSSAPCALYSIDQEIVWGGVSNAATNVASLGNPSGPLFGGDQNPNSRINALMTLAGN